nr:ribonuclease H-like domain-containing protein [Tanacetum cinerariifolium]
MAKSSSSSKNEPCCSKSCKKNTGSLNSKITDLTDKLYDSKNMLFHYKAGLSQVEGRLVEFKNQEIKFCEKIRVLEFSVECKTNRIECFTNELELLKKEREGLKSKLTGFQSASKDLDSLLESQRSDKNKEGLGYNDVPPPAQVYFPLKKDMSWTGLIEFADDTLTDYTRPSSSVESNPDDLQNNSSSASENGESTGSILSKPEIKFVKATDSPTVVKTYKKKTVRKSTVKYAELYRKPSKKSTVKGNQRNWNNLKSQQLGENFVMKNRACFNCGHFDHLSYDCGLGVKKGRTCPMNTHKIIPPRLATHKSYRPPIRPIRPNVNNTRPKNTQDLMIILIHRVKRLERELKSRTPSTKIHKVDRGRSRSENKDYSFEFQNTNGLKKFNTYLEEELSSEPNDDGRDSRTIIGKGTDQLSHGGTENTKSVRRDDRVHPDDNISAEVVCDNLKSAILEDNDTELH